MEESVDGVQKQGEGRDLPVRAYMKPFARSFCIALRS